MVCQYCDEHADEIDRAAQALAEALSEEEPRLKKLSSLRQRAARFLCCGGTSSTLEADSHDSYDWSPAKVETNSGKWWQVLRLANCRHQRSRDVAAYTDASAHSQNAALRADISQMPADTVFQGVIFGESRQADQQVTERLPQAMADPVQSPLAEGFDTMSLASSNQAAHARGVSMTAFASGAHEPQVQTLQQQHCVLHQFGCQNSEGGLVKQHCSAKKNDEQVVGVAPLPEELQEHMVDADADR